MTTSRRERRTAPAPLPPALSLRLDGYQWARGTVGESGAAVYRLHGRPGAPELFLKHGRNDVAGMLAEEMARLRWLRQHLPVPAVEQFTRTADQAWLLMTAMPGTTASALLEANPALGPAVVDALAAFLRRLHAIPVRDCPFDAGHALRLAQARQRIDGGLVDADDFDAERAGWTAAQVWAALHGCLPLAPDLVVTHGDFSLDNILMREGAVAGCIDVGRAGVADRYQDLAIVWRSLGEFDASLQQRLLRAYGIVDADQGKLQFHLLLDELF